MSQFYQGVVAGSLPPTVPTTFVTDVNSPAVPAANTLNVIGGETTEDNVNGIQTDGSSGSDTLTIQLTNRLTGSATTVGAASADVITFSLGATPGVYTFFCNIAGFDSATPSGAGFSIAASARTTGAAAVLLDSQAIDTFDEASTTPSSASLVVSGNNAIFRIVGTAGLTINWNAVGEYVFVS